MDVGNCQTFTASPAESEELPTELADLHKIGPGRPITILLPVGHTFPERNRAHFAGALVGAVPPLRRFFKLS